jgi:WD40 repeat protein/energy-coupling factor transporter ATP-binding protein EcfA2
MKNEVPVNEEIPDPAEFSTQKEFGAALGLARKRAGLTVRTLARVVNLPLSTVGDHCTGRHLPGPDQLRQMLLACGVTNPAQIEAWLAALERVRTARGPRPAGTPAPYRGLAQFDTEDARWFCGRDRLTEDVVGHLRALYDEGGLLAVVGPSGSGKSSLLRAGLIPALGDGKLGVPGSHIWSVALFRPGARPLRELATQLSLLTEDSIDRYEEALRADPHACARLATAAVSPDGYAADPPGGSRLFIVVDQFEEVFTSCEDEQERRAFITALCAAAGQDGGRPAALVLLGLRADFYAQVLDYPALVAALQRHQVIVGPMTEAELRLAITEPARRAKLSVEDGLVEVLLRDLAPAAGHGSQTGAHDPGTLPLLSHALRAAWAGSRGGRLTLADYNATGGIRDAIADSAESVYQKLTPAQQDLARQVFIRLVHIAEDTADTRRRLPVSALPHHDDALPVLDAFIASRLITAEADDVQIAHEVLLRAWPKLRNWIEEERAGTPVHRQLSAAAGVWQDSGRHPSDLYDGWRLATVEDWSAQEAHYNGLNELEREFLAVSVERRVDEEQAARRRTRLLLRLVAALAAVVCAVAFLTVVTFSQKAAVSQQKAAVTQQRDMAVSREVAIEADQLRASDPALAAQLSLAAYQIAPTNEARASLLEATGGPPVTRVLGPAGAVLNAVAYSPDHRELALGAGDGTVRLWAVSRPGGPVPLSAPLAVPSGSVTSVAYSPDGRTLVAGSSDGTVTEWDIADPGHPALLTVLPITPAGPVTSVAFSPDGRILIAGAGERVYRWNAADPLLIKALGVPLRPGSGLVNSVSVSPDGGTLAAGTSTGQVVMWRLRSGAAPEAVAVPQPPGAAAIQAVAFSPDGRTLAAAGKADKVWLWKLAPDRQAALRPAPLTGPTSFVYALAFSPGGQSLAGGSADGEAYVWNLASGAVTAALPHPAPVMSVAFGVGGSALATADTDGAARIWQLPGPVLTGPAGAVFAVAYSPDGHDVAAGSGDGTVRLWDVTDLAHPVSLGDPLTSAGPPGDALDGPVAWGANGLLAAGTLNGGIRWWNVTDPRHPVALPVPQSALGNFIQNVTFDPSGRLTAVASAAGTIELWNTAAVAHPEPLAVINDVTPVPNSQGVLAVSISPNDRVLAAAGDDGSVRLWDIADPGHPKPIGGSVASLSSTEYQVTFSPNGSLLAASGQDGKVRLWQVTNPARPRLLAELAGPVGIVYDVAFTPDGRTIATSDGDATVWLWDISDPASPVSLGSVTGPGKTVYAAAFSPTGGTLVAGSQDGTVRLWLATAAAAARYVCSIAGTTVTSAEWARYVPGLAYRPPCPTP